MNVWRVHPDATFDVLDGEQVIYLSIRVRPKVETLTLHVFFRLPVPMLIGVERNIPGSEGQIVFVQKYAR